ncbi:cation diffusion facilitator family transporter [Butyricicoccus sp.]|uniref:cation diffusion facilitator family transporter n=1 Tax=Butyricicoccus sp. TaxID=2049021 RepID=UPI0037362A2C
MKKHLETCSHAEFERAATKVSMVSIIGNLILSVLKALAGVIAHSGAMISDAVHSASDVFSSIIVIIGVKISAKESDDEHPYGHERFECVAAIVLSVVLFLTGLMIGIGAVQDIAGGDYQNLTIPGVLSLVAAFISIISKEAMYWYTRAYAERYDSSALMADAWHHRSDALSSVGALIGIAAARMGFPVMDAVASLVICFFIAKAAYDIFKDAIDKMVDHSCDKETESALLHCAVCQQGVLGIDMLHTRVFGNKIYVDIEISADSRLSLSEGHRIAEQVHTAIEQEFPKVKHIMVHVNPAEVAAADTLKLSEKAEEKNN